MKLSSRPKVIVIVSLIIFAISLTRTAFTFNDLEGPNEFSSIMALLIGATAILGGGLFEWIVWLANPLYFLSIILFLKGNERAKKISVFAMVLSLSFALWTKVLASESGREEHIIARNSGYVFWILSISILTIGINYCMKTIKSIKEPFNDIINTDDDPITSRETTGA